MLGGFSLLTWSVILFKGGEIIFNKLRNHAFLTNFKDNAEYGYEPHPADSGKAQIARVHQAGMKTLAHAKVQLAIRADKHEAWHNLLERAMRQQILKEKARMESGLGWLASIGSTAPFIGLFGTVWGIMYALEDISTKGSASLEVVAGPIGEALIATAIGIAVAVPAVIAYNFFLRQNRRNVAILDHFASDFLHTTIQDHLIAQTVDEHGHAHSE
ncbi:MotA/TolQ/ExbB proton channel family protein [Candidatus Methylospira mobilis]|uniref:MotA/TolQ/ExbB proton channel family protein n=2 Tax=Candidatus Methylospira mobilis TaxID=1808979 RepID=A0A5Q0BPU0_9GAMM|nr:MotA/TolQ/ExbB proton channel family protein [Candidatus Methylospira mobilis]